MDRSTMDPAKLVTLAEIPVSLKLTYTLSLLVLSIGYLFAEKHYREYRVHLWAPTLMH